MLIVLRKLKSSRPFASGSKLAEANSLLSFDNFRVLQHEANIASKFG